MVRSRKAPLCKGSWHGEAVTEGLCPCAARTAGFARQVQALRFCCNPCRDLRLRARGLLQSASLTAPSEREPRGALRRRGRAVDERLDGVGRKCVQNSRRDVGIAPYARFWIGRNNYHLCVGRAALSPPRWHSHSRTPLRNIRRGGCPHPPVLALRFCCKPYPTRCAGTGTR